MGSKQAKASLGARHTKDCALGAYAMGAADRAGCTCKKSYYYVAYRDESGRLVREPVGRNRKQADRALVRLLDKADKAGGQHRTSENITVRAWIAEYRAALASKANTQRSYASSLHYAEAVFGDRIVRSLDSGDVRRYLTHIKAQRKTVSDATLTRHLRVLHALLEAAVPEYADRNPVKQLHRSHRPRRTPKRASYFTDAELTRLWKALPAEMPAAVYLYLFQLASTTGMRMGELLALRWGDVHLADKELRIARTYVQGSFDGRPIGETEPKSGEARTVDLIPAAATVLERWFGLSSEPGADAELVFPAFTGGHLVGSTITRGILYPAMERASIPREGEQGRTRNFHSFRHSFARLALQSGAPITWVQKQLGHSTISLTVDTYGAWERKAEKQEAERLEGAFPV